MSRNLSNGSLQPDGVAIVVELFGTLQVSAHGAVVENIRTPQMAVDARG
jgi:hypothetical protein